MTRFYKDTTILPLLVDFKCALAALAPLPAVAVACMDTTLTSLMSGL